MSWQGFGYNNSSNTNNFGSWHTTTTQNATLQESMLNSSFSPPGVSNRQPQQQWQWQNSWQDQPQHQQSTQEKQNNRPRSNAGTRSKDFPCTFPGCDRMLESPHNVKQHVREQHTGERPHACELCADDGKTVNFPRPWGLTRHREQVHGIIAENHGRRGAAPAPTTTGGFQYTAPAFVPAPALAPASAPRWNTSPFVAQYGEFAEMGVRLTEENAQMMGPSSNGMQFGSDFGAFGSGMHNAQNGNGLVCDVCGYPTASQVDLFDHMHAMHGFLHSPRCTCSMCGGSYTSDSQLRNGPFRTHQNAGFSQGGQQGAWFPQQAAGDSNDAQGNFGIDPALLSYSSSGSGSF